MTQFGILCNNIRLISIDDEEEVIREKFNNLMQVKDNSSATKYNHYEMVKIEKVE